MIHSQGQIGGCWAHDPNFSIRNSSIANIMRSAEFKKNPNSPFLQALQGLWGEPFAQHAIRAFAADF